MKITNQPNNNGKRLQQQTVEGALKLKCNNCKGRLMELYYVPQGNMALVLCHECHFQMLSVNMTKSEEKKVIDDGNKQTTEVV